MPLWILLWAVLLSGPASALPELLIDPEDGRFDASAMLMSRHGFLPVPLLITEPALGYGGGVAALFVHNSFSERLAAAKASGRDPVAPDISGLIGLGTSNGTWLAGAFHSASFIADRLRYRGALLRPSVNLDYYAPGSSQALGYNLEGWFTAHHGDLRLGNSPWFAGASLTLADFTGTFGGNNLPASITPPELDSQLAGLGLRLLRDNRNNSFSPRQGHYSKAQFNQQLGEFVGDYRYRSLSLDQKSYWQPQPGWVLSLRGRGELTDGEVPFFARPFIMLRGIPAMRYQDQQMALIDSETRVNLDNRWSMVLFAGAGATAASISQFTDSELQGAAGGGVRYLIARLMGWEAGVDLARGPEEWALYIQFGSGWLL